MHLPSIDGDAGPQVGDGDATGDGDGDVTGDGDGDGDGDVPGDGDGDGDGDIADLDAGLDACVAQDDPDCPQRCPEICNGRDDDCDGALDEGPAQVECTADHSHTVCLSGACVQLSCDSGYLDCDDLLENGCERSLSSPSSCGGCNVDCEALPGVATAQCTGGPAAPVCAVSSCVGTRRDCNGDGTDGCEIDIYGSLANCGGCAGTAGHQVCSGLPQVDGSRCNAGQCEITDCATGFADCNDDPADGCERDVGPGGACCVAGVDTDGDGVEDCADACPMDARKTAPGVCGCGAADTDGDGVDDCEDACPMDMAKVAPGDCGCGMADTDGDGDGTANCLDGCPTDPAKTSPGGCGCGMPETDSDGDGTPDCNDACGFSADNSSAGCFPFQLSNVDPNAVDVRVGPDATLDCGDVSVDTSAGAVVITGWCGDPPVQADVAQPTGGAALALIVRDFWLGPGRTMTVTGDRPLIVLARGNAVIDGTIEVSASHGQPGPGGNVACGANNGDAGDDGVIGGGWSDDGGGGGGGGGFGTAGAAGGSCSGGGSQGGVAGPTEGVAALLPLRGGCPGGRGGDGTKASTASGGGGGGAVQISAAGSLTLAGAIHAAGGGGLNGADGNGGGGGGSGGAILLEAGNLSTSAGAWLSANGGGGAGGAPYFGGGGDGADGSKASGDQAAGGAGNSSSGPGGKGASSAGPAGAGSASSGYESRGGGGGGGGVGRIRLNGASSCTNAGQASPAASGC